MKIITAITATTLAVAAPAQAQWETFDALCGSSRTKCQVKFDGEKMTMPGVVIYAEDVVGWNMSDTRHNAVTTAGLAPRAVTALTKTSASLSSTWATTALVNWSKLLS